VVCMSMVEVKGMVYVWVACADASVSVFQGQGSIGRYVLMACCSLKRSDEGREQDGREGKIGKKKSWVFPRQKSTKKTSSIDKKRGRSKSEMPSVKSSSSSSYNFLSPEYQFEGGEGGFAEKLGEGGEEGGLGEQLPVVTNREYFFPSSDEEDAADDAIEGEREREEQKVLQQMVVIEEGEEKNRERRKRGEKEKYERKTTSPAPETRRGQTSREGRNPLKIAALHLSREGRNPLKIAALHLSAAKGMAFF